LEGKTGIASLIVVEGVDVVMLDQSSDGKTVLCTEQ
jgi:hypothetical protein